MLAQQRRETPADIRQRIEGPALIAGHHPCRLPQPPQAVLRHRRQFVDALMDQMMIPVEDLETAPIAFRWADSVAGLDASTDTANGMCAAQFELGDPALETMRLYMQRLNPGPTPTMQTTANSLYAVIEGEGQSVIDGEVYPWARGDVIAVPSWRAFRHEPKGSAVMLRVTDKPIFEKFGWLRETFA